MSLACPNRGSLAIVIAARHDPKTSRSFDRLTLLVSCLQSISDAVVWDQRQAGNGWKEIKIILVDDYSPVPLVTLLPLNILDKIHVLRNGRTPGQAGALNYVLLNSSADVFAFTDSDCMVAQDWISKLHEHYINFPNRVGVGGPNWLFAKSPSFWKRFLTHQEATLARYIFASYIDFKTTTTRRIDCRNLSLRTDFLAKYYKDGFFQEGSGPSVSGQASANLRNILSNNGLVVGYEPKALTYHKSVDGLVNQVKAYYRWGRQGDYYQIYSDEFGSLRKAFFKRYLKRHFVSPAVKDGVFWPYLLLVHGAYWIGILKKQKSRS